MVLVVSTRKGAGPLLLARTGHFLLVTDRWFSPCSGRTVRPHGGDGKRSAYNQEGIPNHVCQVFSNDQADTFSGQAATERGPHRPKRAALVHRTHVAYPQSFPASHATGRLSLLGVPVEDRRTKLSPVKALLVLLRNRSSRGSRSTAWANGPHATFRICWAWPRRKRSFCSTMTA